jgi:hypothetical protein
MFALVLLCCVVLYKQKPLRQADHSSKGVLPSILISLRNVRCEAAKVILRTVQPLMTIIINDKQLFLIDIVLILTTARAKE